MCLIGDQKSRTSRKIPKQESTAAFKEPAVKRVKEGKTVGAVAKEMDLLVEPTLRHWVKASAAGQRAAPGVRKVTLEEMEQSRRRAEVIRLKRGRHPKKPPSRVFPRPMDRNRPLPTLHGRHGQWPPAFWRH
jgi:transposase